MFFLLLFAFQDVKLQAPNQIDAGAKITISWSHTPNPKDFVTIVPPDTPEGKYDAYSYAGKGSWEANAPEVAGDYEIRYLAAENPYPTLAKKSLKVNPVTASLEFSPQIGAGGTLSVKWNGPANHRDFITVVPKGHPERKYGKYVYVRDKNPISLQMPGEPGDYEIRYLTGQKYYTLASAPITITSVSASLSAPASAKAGSEIEIAWEGPDNQGDFITIVTSDAPEKQYKRYKYTRQGSPITLQVPDQPGDYEIRYLMGDSRKTLATANLRVGSVEASLSFDSSVPAGAILSISWDGPGNDGDFITIVPADTPETNYKKYKYAKKSPIELKAPEEPGPYEVRYLMGQSRSTLVAQPLTVLGVDGSISIPKTAAAGSPIEVNWTGPDNKGDFITIVPADLPETNYKRYKYTKQGSPVTLFAPDEPGSYEVRYLFGDSRKTLTKASIEVTATHAEVTFDSPASAGSDIFVSWQGPNNKGDFITIVNKGEQEGKYGRYRYTSSGNPCKLRVPDEPATYEVRYLTGQSRNTLASAELVVKEVTASVSGPNEVQANTFFEVEWQGPNNRGDYISISPEGSDPKRWKHYRYTQSGNPVRLKAPSEEGAYELRYQMGQSYTILASQNIQVGPAEIKPGFLTVLSGPQTREVLTQEGAVEVILDASGSMLQKLGSERRINVAKDVLNKLVSETLIPDSLFALRVFGHIEPDACRTDLLQPPSPLDPQAMKTKIGSIQAQNLAKTPIADSLALIEQDLKSVKGPKMVVLITDGEETCGGDPAEVIEGLRKRGIQVTVNIVGFAIDEEALEQQFRYWSELGGGHYFQANDSEGLEKALTDAVNQSFEVQDAQGNMVVRGSVDGPRLELMPGEYTVILRKGQKKVTISAEKATMVNLD